MDGAVCVPGLWRGEAAGWVPVVFPSWRRVCFGLRKPGFFATWQADLRAVWIPESRKTRGSAYTGWVDS